MTSFETEDSFRFAQWAMQTLHCQLQSGADSACKVSLPEELRADWEGASSLRFHTAANGQAQSEPAAGLPAHAADDDGDESGMVLDVGPSSRLFQWLVEKLSAMGPATHASPVSQPASVHEMSPALFSAFEFEQGHIYLAGCRLEDRPLVRLSTLNSAASNGQQLQHYFFWPDGQKVDEATLRQLQLQPLAPYQGQPPEQGLTAIGNWVDNCRCELKKSADQFVAATIVWCKYAEGKLAFRADAEEDTNKELAVELPFAAWATALASAAAKPPAYHCPLSNCDTYRLAVTDDGRIAAAEAIECCEVSGKRVLLDDLLSCTVTKKRVLSEFLQACACSGDLVMTGKLVPCTQCEQNVSPAAVKGGRCQACRSLAPVRKEDPRMARLLDEYPKLDSWPRWRLAETDQTYLLLAHNWLRQLLLVVEKDLLQVTHVTTSGRFFSHWQEMPRGQREELLGG